MIPMEMLGKIRRVLQGDKMSLHAITKQTDLSRNTLRMWLSTTSIYLHSEDEPRHDATAAALWQAGKRYRGIGRKSC